MTWCKKRKREVSYPKIKNTPIILRNDCFKVSKSKNTQHFDYWLNFRRTKFPLVLCEYHKELLEKSTTLKESQIVKRGNEFRLQLTLEIPNKNYKVHSNDTILGVDAGIIKPLYCSDGRSFGNGKYLIHLKKEYQKKRSKQQSKSQEISNKQSRWIKDYNHKISRELIEYCLNNNYTCISLENLKGHKLSNPKGRKYSWAFAQLKDFITYKASLEGIEIVTVKPHNTSITCSKCLTKDRRSRISQSKFECVNCSYTSNADLNASINIKRLSPFYELL